MEKADIKEILTKYKTVAVVGLSPDAGKPSHEVAAYLQRAGYRIVPVNPSCREIFGERCYPDVSSIPFPIDIVDIFRRPEFVPEIMEQAIAKGAKVVWMQEGIMSEEARLRGEEAGVAVIMDRCMLKEHAKLAQR